MARNDLSARYSPRALSPWSARDQASKGSRSTHGVALYCWGKTNFDLEQWIVAE